MKIAKHLLSAAVLFSSASCFFAKNLSVSSAEANANQAAQSVSASYIERRSAAGKQTNARQTTPEAIIKDLYKVHAEDFKSLNDRILNYKNRTYIDRYFDKNLGNLIWKDLATHKKEIGVIDFDLFYNAQDAEIKNLIVGQAKIEGDKAIVPVSFTNYDEKQTVTYLLKQQNGAWKIYDIKYGSDSLLKYFEQDAKNNAAYKNFEGTYQVGNTIATIKPGKMSFELRWAKGAGAMMFFFEGNDSGKYVFSSEDKGKGPDKFIFDDESLTTGKFVRADGREMPVKKINNK